MRGMPGLTWMLPICSIGFFAFAGTAIVGAIAWDMQFWLLAAIALPAIPFVWLGLMLSLMDVTRRPPEHLSEEARMIWAATLAILNVFAFIPYWLIVVRGNPPLPADTAMKSSAMPSRESQPQSESTQSTPE
jgi:hypothetical protein